MENAPQNVIPPAAGLTPEAPQPSPIQQGNPYFMGDQALVKFSSGEGEYGSPTYWLVDKSNNTVRPFESEGALQKAFGEGYEAAKESAALLAPPSVDQNGEIVDGVLRNFSVLGPEYGVREDGSSKNLEFSPSQLKKRYGKEIDPNAEGLAAEAVEGLLGLIATKEAETGIGSDFLNQIKQDSQLMAFYISALAYGGYTLSDIYTDVARRSQPTNQ